MLIYLVNMLLISCAVLIHYQALSYLSLYIPRWVIRHHARVLASVLGCLCAHVIEIWLFGIAYYVIHLEGSLGSLVGSFTGTLMDSVYFSFSAYTSLGIGDIEPVGDVRFLAGLEALTGLVLIAWTASFVFLEMNRYWRTKK
ncbi:MAG: hypothetical protein ACI9NY_000021 [Kiritimatiellia bacterium]|jgi:hypothetical protein